ncbi:NlpC/P60 family protein [Guptibacillus algicola]|uniref:C40 family peptidase n=1 Tax=Guptibacillus algicola TaxID=225844 RepID=UPI001CD59037|nr:NlpC/P60 family protein [Alkalihalobacillus algicola]MCA0988242.1 NlpC/P60 family protein [Alkalihalobacillus algicola]
MELTKKTISVTVATLWSTPDSARPMDDKALHNPVDLEGWLDELPYSPRLELCDNNLVQSQVLYGEEVLIVEEKDNWSHVIVPSQPSSKDSRGYPGWIPTNQLSNEVYGDKNATVIVNKHGAVLTSPNMKTTHHLSYQTRLPLLEETGDDFLVWSPHGDKKLKKRDGVITPNDVITGSGEDIVKNAEQFIGLLYLWGGMSSYGYDCSGFSYNMARTIGCTIPRDASDQMKSGKVIQNNEWEKGDLLFFAYEQGKGSVHHVGIYYGDGKMIHSPSTGRFIEVTPLKGTLYEEELCGIRRYWEN